MNVSMRKLMNKEIDKNSWMQKLIEFYKEEMGSDSDGDSDSSSGSGSSGSGSSSSSNSSVRSLSSVKSSLKSLKNVLSDGDEEKPGKV